MNQLILNLTITLLEDLHSGTGTGDVLIDAVQARDPEGYPVIDRHHVRGVLKDNAERLVALAQWDDADLQRLFGAAGGKRRSLDVSSLRVTDRNGNPNEYFITWDSTARRPGSRCPEDHSLRRIEYIRAGTQLTGRITIDHPQDGDQARLERLLRFTTRLGGGRTRGDGQIMVKWKIDEATETVSAQAQAWGDGGPLRLLLKAAEPINIPTTGYAGNIIKGESHLPGRVLFAALCVRAEDNQTLKNLFTDKLQVGNAYPLPNGLTESALEKLQVMPMPAHLHRIKQGAATQARDLRWPHWAGPPGEEAPCLREGIDADMFHYEDKDKDKTSRPKGALYLIKDAEGNWRRYQQPLEVRMRNRRGKFNDATIKRTDTELFSEQRIPAGTHFLADIHCQDDGLKATLINWLAPGQRLRIGRSKAPVEVVSALPLEGQNNEPETRNDELVILATSDWLVRGDNLGWLQRLGLNSLLRNAFGLDAGYAQGLKLEAYQETETQGSFNYATQLPRRPFAVIRRGSVFRITGEEQAINTLFDAIKAKAPVGERTTEGYGQFIFNPAITLADAASEPEQLANPEPDAAQEETSPETGTDADANQAGTGVHHEKEEATNAPPAGAVTEGCRQRMSHLAHEYFKLLEQNSKSNPPSGSLWVKLKKALIKASEDATFALAMNPFIGDCDYLYKDQKGDNLAAYLRKQFKDETNPNCLPAFLDALEQLIYKKEDA